MPGVAGARSWRWWDVGRIVVVLVWLLAAATAWWTAPRQESYDRARADVSAGHVVAYRWGDRWDTMPADRQFAAPELASSGTLGPLFAWRTPDGRVHWTDTADFDEVTKTGEVQENAYSGAGAVGIAQALKTPASAEGSLSPAGAALNWLEIGLAVLFLGVVVAGRPDPALGTRWFWFWLVITTPYWLGLLFWLVRDRPWTRPGGGPARSATPPTGLPPGGADSATVTTVGGAGFAPATGFGPTTSFGPTAGFGPAAGKDGGRQRDRGWLGLVIGLTTSLLISLLVAGLHAVLGSWWVPG